MSLERYANWLTTQHIQWVDHGRWLQLPDHQIAVVVTITPPLSRNATIAALLRVTDPDLPVLVESFNVPYGELFDCGNRAHTRLGIRTWITIDGHTLHLAQPVRPE